jgi:HD-like signal output (HDOD) protein
VRTLDPAAAERTLAALERLPPFPPVAAAVLSRLGRADTGFRAVAEQIGCDAALAAQVLRLANSPLIGGARVTSLLAATTLLGVERLSALVVTLTLCKVIRPVSRLPAVRRLFRQNLAVALLCREGAPVFDLEPDTAYTAGLLHDLGALALLLAFPRDYAPLLDGCRGIEALLRAERRAFDTDHMDAGALVARNWRLPEFLYPVIATHHRPSTQAPLLVLVGAAITRAAAAGFSLLDIPAAEPDLGLTEQINGLELEFGLVI